MKQPQQLFRYNAPFTMSFSLICFIVYLLGHFTEGKSTELVFSVYNSPMDDALTYIRFFFYPFGHRNWADFASVIIPILVVGPNLEERYGAWPLVIGSVVTVFLSGPIHFFAFPEAGPMSGAGGIMYLMFLMASTGGEGGGIPITMLSVIAAYAYSAILGMGSDIHVDHIVGGAIGALFGMSLRTTPTEPPPQGKKKK